MAATNIFIQKAMMTNEQHNRAKDLFVEVQDSLGKIRSLIKELTGPGYDPADDEYRDALHEAASRASDSRLALLRAYGKQKISA